MGEIKPTGVFLAFDLSSLNGVDPAVLEAYVRKIPGIRVVVPPMDNLDPKPDLILKEIRKYNLKRIVLAGYEPGMNKSAFSVALKAAGLDPANVTLASFSEYGVRGTEEAKATLYCAIHGIPYPEARKNGSVGPFKEFSFWLSKNPLVGQNFFEDLKRLQTSAEIDGNIYQLALGYRLVDWESASLTLYGGARYYDIEVLADAKGGITRKLKW